MALTIRIEGLYVKWNTCSKFYYFAAELFIAPWDNELNSVTLGIQIDVDWIKEYALFYLELELKAFSIVLILILSSNYPTTL